MPIPLPQLDDRRYDELLEEMRSHIHHYIPRWTDYNPSDPGVTLLELFVWLTETVIYRVDQVPAACVIEKFPRLLGGETGSGGPDVVEHLFEPYRAVTREDFEALAVEAGAGQVARAHCLSNRNLEYESKFETGHVTVVILPGLEQEKPVPSRQLIERVHEYLHSRRLITTRLHIVGPRYVDIRIPFRVAPLPYVDPVSLNNAIRQRLYNFLNPVTGGLDGRGWPFGRDVYLSEIYRVIEETPGVDYTIEAALETSHINPRTDKVHLGENDLPWYVPVVPPGL